MMLKLDAGQRKKEMKQRKRETRAKDDEQANCKRLDEQCATIAANIQ